MGPNGRIDLRDPAEVELWTAVLRVYARDLVEAVTAVGDGADEVLAHLHARGLARHISAGSYFRPRIPDKG